MRKQNIILFSAGESKANGKTRLLKEFLENNNITCVDWSNFFQYANDNQHIALFPYLIKKIPSFDFAIILAEAVDTASFRHDTQRFRVMRDNVLFELGLCSMSLGPGHVILLSDSLVHIPEDLMGIGEKIAIQQFKFRSDEEFYESMKHVHTLIQNNATPAPDSFDAQLRDMLSYIDSESQVVDPVTIGAAISSAESYFMNFIVRFWENIDNGFYEPDHPGKKYSRPETIRMEIRLPKKITSKTRSLTKEYYERNQWKSYRIDNAGPRGLDFRAKYSEETDTLQILDIPTSVSASFMLVRSILNIPSDDSYDEVAENRFLTKELDLYHHTLSLLLKPEIASEKLSEVIPKPEICSALIQELNYVSISEIDLT